ncbi:C2HC5-type zinc finger protein [Sporobolomyces salmoneus]|uniref:C2HC5-type zinc finger protein n=1 Tax=Sporobolomyces salmoneus TaxID=183962 RepID=UPI003176CC67
MAPSLASQLAPLIGLDEQTVSEQILPHLSTITSAQEIKNYLLTLLAPGKASQEFIASYLSLRFPSNSSSQSTQATSKPSSRWATPSQSRSASPLPPTSTSRIYQEEKRKEVLQKAFNGGNGKIYRKNEGDDAAGWGGKSSSNSRTSSTAGSSRVPTSQSASIPVQTKSTPSSSTSTTTTKGKSKQIAGIDIVEFSPSALSQLHEIDRSLKSFTSSKSKSSSSCFCSARQHPLSPFVPLCPSCSLVLCSLNSPISPCPSCSHSPLLPTSLTSTYSSDLTHQRESLISREKERFERKKREEELERRRIKFPELGSATSDYAPQSGGGLSGGGYAGYAVALGGGGSFQERIQRSYETGISLNGRNFGAESIRANSAVGGGGGKVLRLDGKGKVKVETKKKKPSSAKKENVRVSNETEEEEESDDEEDDDGMIPWTDPTDDGIRSSTSVENVSTNSTTTKRVFENYTILEVSKRPVWIEREEMSHSIVEVDEVEGKEVESVPDTRGARSEKKVVGAAGNAGGSGGKGKKGARN